MANIDIFNQPVNMRLGGVASNPLDSYGDYLSQQIDNTQVEPFIQEVEQMASQRFNLNGGSSSGGQSVFGPLKTFNASQPSMEIAEPLISPSIFQRVPQQYPQDLSRPGDLSRPLETAGEPLLSIFDSGINGFRPFNPPQIQDTMARPVDPLKDKNGILREPMDFRGGSNIFNMINQRIFNEGFMPEPAQLTGGFTRAFFDGGEVGDFSDFGGFDDPSDPFGGDDNTDFSDPDSDMDYTDSYTDQDFTDATNIGSGGDNQPGAFPTSRPEILKEAIARAENEVFGGTESDALGFINKDGSLTDAGQKEYDSSIMANLDVLQDERPSDAGTQLASIFDNKDILAASTKNVNPADIVQASFRPSSLNSTFSNDVLDGLDLNTAFGGNRGAKTDTGVIGSTDAELNALERSIANTQRANEIQNQLANVNNQTLADRVQNQRGLGIDISTIPDISLENIMSSNISKEDPNKATVTQNISPQNTADRISRNNRTIDDIKADMGSRVPDTALETMAGRIGPVDTVFDIDTTDTRNFVGDDFETALNLVNRNEEDKLAAEQAMGVGTAPNLQNLTSSAMGRGIKPFEPPPIVAPGIEAPKEFREPFKNAGIGAIPTLTSLANKFSNYSRGRVLDSIAQKGYTPVYDGDVIVGSKDKFGNLMEGMDPNAPMGSDDNNENPFVIKPKPEEEKEEEDKPPNVIGGGDPLPVPEPVPTVVDSPFTSNVSDFVPSTFNTGDINKLIEMLTGVAAPKSMKKGGVAGYAEGGKVMQALDNLLATA
jgi:TolA-binding protein